MRPEFRITNISARARSLPDALSCIKDSVRDTSKKASGIMLTAAALPAAAVLLSIHKAEPQRDSSDQADLAIRQQQLMARLAAQESSRRPARTAATGQKRAEPEAKKNPARNQEGIKRIQERAAQRKLADQAHNDQVKNQTGRPVSKPRTDTPSTTRPVESHRSKDASAAQPDRAAQKGKERDEKGSSGPEKSR